TAASQAAHGGSIPLTRFSLSPIVNDVNEPRRTLSNVLTASSDHLWHQSRKTRISPRRVRSGSPVSTVLGATEGSGDSNGAQKQPTENWRRDWTMNGSSSKNWPEKDG